jgi:hypothetical protein
MISGTQILVKKKFIYIGKKTTGIYKPLIVFIYF